MGPAKKSRDIRRDMPPRYELARIWRRGGWQGFWGRGVDEKVLESRTYRERSRGAFGELEDWRELKNQRQAEHEGERRL